VTKDRHPKKKRIHPLIVRNEIENQEEDFEYKLHVLSEGWTGMEGQANAVVKVNQV
jgi:hypothetical protein